MFKRILGVLQVCAILLALSMTSFAYAEERYEPTIRVFLRRLQIQDSIHIVTEGTYMLEDGSMLFSDGSEMNISLRSGQLVLHTGHTGIKMGESIKLIRCEDGYDHGLTLNGNGKYEGDLLLEIVSDAIRPILYIHIEDYLLGVVPFEMGDSFPLEALKAQAIAARTYALMKSNSDGAYDVDDTTNDQAFRGRTTSSPLSEKAVVETEGLCGTYNGSLARCNYSASNGGQTELGYNVWPNYDPSIFGHMDMRDDPYDYENPASLVKRFTLPKNTRKNELGELLNQALISGLSDTLMALGKETEPDCVRIDEIRDVKLLEPKHGEASKLMTQMQFTLRLSTRDCLYRDIPNSVQETVPELTEGSTPAPTHTPHPTATPAYTKYTALDEPLTVTLPIFPTIEQAMGLSISTAQNELYSVFDIGSSFMIESRRYGHGVGMSQRGAEQMASKYDMTYDQILSFYYPNMDVEHFALEHNPLPTPDMLIMATPAPTASPTPRPTLMPVTKANMPKGSHIAVVANIAEDSSLNLRESPSMSAEVRRRLYYNQELIVLKSTKDGWSHVKTDVIEGYVRSEYLQNIDE